MTTSETFEKLDWPAISLFIQQRQEENVNLDFKLVGNAGLTRDDRRNFAKSASGFANSNGGIIIWGIDARKNAEGVDCATAIVEIDNPALMVTRLNALSGEATSPIMDGLKHKAILNPTTGQGVVATLVPESDGGPYMAKLGEQRYYKRSGDSFYQMEHFDLEDMFGRRRKAVLKFDYAHSSEGEIEILSIRIQNIGRAVARYVGFTAEFQNAEVLGVDGPIQNISPHNSVPMIQYEKNVGVIHPNGHLIKIGAVRLRRLVGTENVQVKMLVYCEGIQAVESRIRF